MEKLSKRRGAISVFLLLIFMVSYVFMGLLVDAGRYRMAQAYAESALDNASNSLLSNYNKLVYDMYGLFAMDINTTDKDEMEAEMRRLYEEYLGEVMGIVQITDDSYTTKLADLIFNENDKLILDATSLYDFQMDLMVGTDITLADSANVENQIIEYMKFRAPIQLVDDMNGFLNKMQEILTVKDSVAIAVEKNDIVQKYENPKQGDGLSSEAYNLMKKQNRLARILYNYTIDAVKALPWSDQEITKSAKTTPYKLLDVASAFDTALEDADDRYEENRNNVESAHCTQLYEILNELYSAMKPKEKDISLSGSYMKDEKTTTKQFFEVNRMECGNEQLIDLAEEVKEEAEKRTKGNDMYNTFLLDYHAAEETREENLKGVEETYREDISNAKKTLVNKVKMIEKNAGELLDEIQVLCSEMDAVYSRYQNYINELESKLEEHKNDSDYEMYKTQYAPTLELAQANSVEIIQCSDLFLLSRKELENICYGYKPETDGERERLSEWISDIADTVISNRDKNSASTLCSQIKVERYSAGTELENLYKNPYQEAAQELFSSIQGDICVLFSRTDYYYDAHLQKDVDVISKDELSGNDVSESGKNTLEKQKPIGLSAVDNQLMREHPDWLKVNYTYKSALPSGGATGIESGEVDIGFWTKILNTITNLFDALEDLLKGARDNLYVDAYVMSTFSNYEEWRKWENGASESKMKYLNAPYYEKDGKSFNASFAEVEYIITGKGGDSEKGFGQQSVEAIRGKLFGTRMLFNTLSILFDSAKISQAQSLTAWAGPFAPLASIVLLAAWSAIESVIDVGVLMGEPWADDFNKSNVEGVLIYKGGEDWYFSKEGAATLMGNMAIDTVLDKVADTANTMIKSLESKTNLLVYKAYTSTQETVDDIFKEINLEGAKEVVSWGQELTGELSKLDGDFSELNQQLENAQNVFQNVEEMKAGVEGMLGDANKEAAIIIARMSTEAQQYVKTGVNSLKKTAKDALSTGLDKVIPYGKVKNTGTNIDKPRMTYRDYLYFYLFTMDSTDKIQRIQSVIQANMRVGGDTDFTMECAPASIWADMECSIKYLFLSNPIVPEEMKKNGRMRFKVISAQSY